MKMWKILLPVAALLLLAGTAHAQSAEESVEAKKRQEIEAKRQEVTERLREAEERMAVAAREIAELSRERIPQMVDIERRIELSKKPRLGITIEGDDEKMPVEGVEIIAVTPGTAADDAGMRAGDIIIAVSGKELSAENSMLANEILLKVIKDVEEGDVLTVDFLRNGNIATVDVAPRVVESHAFTWVPDAHGQLHFPDAPDISVFAESVEPGALDGFRMKFGFPLVGSAWGDMELVELNEGLGRYFGTDSGLLVVNAPKLDGMELQDGDVIQSIDGRAPTDVRHALRILGSYDGGEKLELSIMRDKKKRKLDIEVPADHRGSRIGPPPAISPVSAPDALQPGAAPPPPVVIDLLDPDEAST